VIQLLPDAPLGVIRFLKYVREGMKMSVVRGYFNCLNSYVVRGRPYRELPLQKLFEEWLAAFKTLARAPCGTGIRTKLNDLTSEFHFRGRIPPYYQAKIEAYELIRAVDAALEVLQNEYPPGRAAAMGYLQSAINGGAVDGEKKPSIWSDEPLGKHFPRSALCE
jgi:hypothetical protein